MKLGENDLSVPNTAMQGVLFGTQIPPEILDKILLQRSSIHNISECFETLLALTTIERALATSNIVGILHCLDHLIGKGKDENLRESVQRAAINCVQFFGEDFMSGNESIDTATGLNKSLCIFPRQTEGGNIFIEELHTMAFRIIPFCITKMNELRAKSSSNLKFYNLICYILYNCMIRIERQTAQIIERTVDPKLFKLPKKYGANLYEWCREIGFDIHECHDIHLALYGEVKHDDKLIQNAVVRERKRQNKIKEKAPPVIDFEGEEGSRF